MSHWSKIKFQIKSIQALRKASAELGGELVEGSKTVRARGYGGALREADYIIKIPNAEYDIAVTKKEDNTFEMQTDFWQGSVEKIMGKGLDKLNQSYSVNNAEIECQKLGHSVVREWMKNGNVKLTVSVNQ